MLFWIVYIPLGAVCAWMDIRTRYLPPWLLVPAGFLLVFRVQISSALFFCLVMSLLWTFCRDKIGSADIWAFWFLALYFGSSFYLILILACLTGIVWSRFEPCIPFMACLFAASMLLAPWVTIF